MALEVSLNHIRLNHLLGESFSWPIMLQVQLPSGSLNATFKHCTRKVRTYISANATFGSCQSPHMLFYLNANFSYIHTYNLLNRCTFVYNYVHMYAYTFITSGKTLIAKLWGKMCAVCDNFMLQQMNWQMNWRTLLLRYVWQGRLLL